MNQNRVLIIIMTALLLVVAACTTTTEAPEAKATATAPVAVIATSTAEPRDEVADEPTATPSEEPTAVSPGNGIGGTVELVDALRAAGATVNPAGAVEQPFFSVSGQVIAVDGGEVQLFEYPDAAGAAAEAALISPDGSSVGTSMMSWMATPNFYAKDRLIALYVGDDQALVDTLTRVLGQPVAEGQMSPGLPVVEESAAYPAGTSTGVAELDAIIEAVLGHDTEALQSLTQYTVVGCTHADGLGGPPKCEASEAEGTAIEVVPILGPEGHHLRQAEYEAWPGPDARGLLAAYRVSAAVYSDEAYPAGEFALLFLGPNNDINVTLQVAEGRIVRFDFDFRFGISTEEKLRRDAAEFILPLYGSQAVSGPEPNTAAMLIEALSIGDSFSLEALMGESLTVGYWQSEGQILTPAEAIELLRRDLLLNPGLASFTRDRALFPDLGSFNPAAAFGPDVQIVDMIFSQGWGPDGLGEAILTVAGQADGSRHWQGLIYGSAGFG